MYYLRFAVWLSTTHCKWDVIIPFDKLWEQYNRIIKDNGAVVLFNTEPFGSQLRLSNIKNYKYDWIWDKISGTGFLNAKKQPMRNHELISVFYKKQCTYNPQMTHGHILKKSFKSKNNKNQIYGKMDQDVYYESTDRYPRSILVFSKNSQNSKFHPSQKPVELIEYLIKTYTNEGEVILDNCIGSGTTAIAALNTGRDYIGFENDKAYFDIASQRITQYVEQQLLTSDT